MAFLALPWLRPPGILAPDVASFKGGRSPEARVVLDQWRMDYNHRRPHGGLKWMTPSAFIAGLDDTASGAVPAASRGVFPVGATPLPPTHHADCSPTLS